MTIQAPEIARRMAGDVSKVKSVIDSAKRVVAKIQQDREKGLGLHKRSIQALMFNGRSILKRLDIWANTGRSWFFDVGKPRASDPRMDRFVEQYMDNSQSIWRLGEKLFGGEGSLMWGLGNQAIELGLGDVDAKTVIFLIRELDEKAEELVDTIKRMNTALVQADKLVEQAA